MSRFSVKQGLRMKGKLKILYFLEEINTAVPIRSYFAMYLLEKGFPLLLATWISGFDDPQSFVIMMAQLHKVRRMATPVPLLESDSTIKPGSLREKFIEYIQSNRT